MKCRVDDSYPELAGREAGGSREEKQETEDEMSPGQIPVQKWKILASFKKPKSLVDSV